MEPADRCAAYLAGELDDDARRTFEDDLDRDAALRATLADVRRADAALGQVGPTALPTGAEGRLLERLASELDATLGAASPTAVGGSGSDEGDELAARRARRSPPWAAIGGLAAAAVAVGVVALGPLGLGGAGDDAADEAVSLSAGDDAAMESAPAEVLPSPVLRATGRDLDEAAVDALLDEPGARELADTPFDPRRAEELAASYAAAFGVTSRDVSTTADGPAVASEDAADDGDLAAGSAPRAALQVDGEVDAATREQLATCLETLLIGAGPTVPLTAEVATFEGEPAVVFTLVGEAGGDPVDRIEVWVLARDDCSVLRFVQR